jgi:hypothetical protein
MGNFSWWQRVRNSTESWEFRLVMTTKKNLKTLPRCCPKCQGLVTQRGWRNPCDGPQDGSTSLNVLVMTTIQVMCVLHDFGDDLRVDMLW